MKKYIPNILTTYRAIIAILIPILFIKSYYIVFIILFSSAIISDFVDGYLARKWDIVSNYGKIVDAIGDKLLAISSLIMLIIFNSKYFIILLVLEFIILGTNILIYIFSGNLKSHNYDNRNTSIYGKAKTIFLFLTLLIGYISFHFNCLNIFILPFIYITSILQVITAIFYIKDR